MMHLAVSALLARAGGGDSFDGGGGLGGGGFGGGSGLGGGGGFFFFGGSGGGGGTGAVGVVVVIVIAALILFMFRNSLRQSRRSRRGGGFGGGPGSNGNSGGYGADAGGPDAGGWDAGGSGSGSGSGGSGAGSEAGRFGSGGPGRPSAEPPPWAGDDRPAIDSVSGDLFPGSARATITRQADPADGLAAITAHDPGFDKEQFLQQVQRTFFVVQEAWTSRKPDMSRQVMADGLWQEHKVQIETQLAAHKHDVMDGLAVGSLRVMSAHTDARYDTIVVRVIAASADYEVDDGSGKVLRGHKEVQTWQEDWTFQRSSSATTPDAGGTMTAHCPNCGAPLDLDLAGVCRYCKAPVSTGQYDWVLARISQVGY